MHNLDKDILIENIKRLMKEHDVTQPKLADDLHIGQPSISKCLNGKQSISIDLIYSIAQYFDVSIDSLCSSKDASAATSDDGNDRRTRALRKASAINDTCDALAVLFKLHRLDIKEIDHIETIYEEQIYRENGMQFRQFVKKKGVLGTDTTSSKYNAIFYPNYYEVPTSFDNDDDYSDFMSEISYSGNALTENIRINKVLNQLIDLLKIYKNGSLPEEAYLHSIDAIITQAKKQF